MLNTNNVIAVRDFDREAGECLMLKHLNPSHERKVNMLELDQRNIWLR